jgi:hypothetical protein
MNMSLKEYLPGTEFPGVIGRTVDDSSPAWPVPKRAKAKQTLGQYPATVLIQVDG